MKVQRLRFRFRITPAALELSRGDIVDAWVEAAKAAGLPLSYSAGKRETAQVALAAPLPQGVTSDWELLDIFLSATVEPKGALAGLKQHLPEGIELTAVEPVGVNAPAVQASLRWAEYEVDIPAEGQTEADVRGKIEALLAADTFPAEHRREKKVREYDLRPLVIAIQLCGEVDGAYRLRMRLKAEQDNTARADQTALAIGLPEPSRVHRLRLEVEETPAAIQAFRRHGEREDR